MRGFTMLELIITIAIAAILLALAVPSFTSFLNANQVTTQANELLATFQVARMESIKRSARVVVCATGDANAATPSCANSSTWAVSAQSNDGWISFVDANASECC
jgi:type IV fimbrial biogenesis protein FimT